MAKTRFCGDDWISLWKNEQGTVSVKMGDGVIIVPVNQNSEALMITEPSVAYDGMRFLGLPAGGIEEGEDPADAANRELQEELDFKAKRLDSPGTIYMAARYVDAKFNVYVAT